MVGRCVQENARGMYDTLKGDVSSLKLLTSSTVDQMPSDMSVALAVAADENKHLRLQLQAQQAAMHVQLEEERSNTQSLLEKERSAMLVQMEVRCCCAFTYVHFIAPVHLHVLCQYLYCLHRIWAVLILLCNRGWGCRRRGGRCSRSWKR